MFGNTFPLFKLFGIQVQADLSWVIKQESRMHRSYDDRERRVLSREKDAAQQQGTYR